MTATRTRKPQVSSAPLDFKEVLEKYNDYSIEYKDARYLLIDGAPVQFRMDTKFPFTYTDEHGKKQSQEVCLCEGEHSIFTKDQDKATRKKRRLIFTNGVLNVPANDHLTHLILAINPGNELNGGTLFKKEDRKADAKKKNEAFKEKMEAMTLLNEKATDDWESCISLARALGYPIDGVDPEEILQYLTQELEKDYVKFTKMWDNPKYKFRSLIIQAQNQNFIKIQNNVIMWPNDQVITNCIAGVDPIEHLTNLALSGKKEGQNFIESLQERMKVS